MLTLKDFILSQQGNALPNQDAWLLLSAISKASLEIATALAKPNLQGLSGARNQKNIHGETQQKLDIFSHERFVEHFKNSGIIRGMASEESTDLIAFKTAHKEYIVNIDPLDGSSNIDVNVCVGSIFSVYPRPKDARGSLKEKDFLQKGRAQVMAGYTLYGAATMLVFTLGNGVFGFTLDPKEGNFILTHPNITFPKGGKIFSISEGYYHQFPQYIKDYIAHCKDIENRLHTARYVGSLVADFHRNLLKGGVYAYPTNHSCPEGKLRLMYECNPIALLAEQADGLANNGGENILDIIPLNLHQTTPMATGPKDMMVQLQKYYEQNI